MKTLILNIYYIVQSLVLWIPLWPIRWFWLKIFLKKLGKGCFVARNVDVRKPWNIIIGNNTIINKGVLLDGRGKSLIIGDNVDIAQDSFIWTLTHDINSSIHEAIGFSTIISDHVWIGARTMILSGLTIGRGAVIGAGSIVTKSIPDLCVVAGNPAKVIKKRENDLTYTLSIQRFF